MRSELISLIDEPLLESHVIIFVDMFHYLLVLFGMSKKLAVLVIVDLFIHLFFHDLPMFFLAESLSEDSSAAKSGSATD